MNIFTIARTLLRPIVRFGLRRSLKIQDVYNALKLEYISLASQELRDRGEAVTVSKLSAMTGLQRKELASLLKNNASDNPPRPDQNLIVRILGQWQYDKRFSRKDGQPKLLTTEGIESEFASLVRTVSSDLNHHTVLFELDRLGYIERKEGAAKLLASAYNNKVDQIETLTGASYDIDDLYRAVELNVSALQGEEHLHARTTFDNIAPEDLPKLRQWLLRAGSAFHQKASKYLSKFDRDIQGHKSRSSNKGEAGRVVIGTFGLTEILPSSKQKTASREKK